jgi:cell division protein FtsZ
MIELPRHTATPAAVRIKILGLGGAGANALDRIKLDGLEGTELIAINTDMQSLTSSVADRKVQLGSATTRGLGAGGDPEVGFAAAEEAVEEIREALQGATLVFLCVGLGGGTGSGAARIITSIAREQQAMVVVFATMPFSFEGKRRMGQAEEALAALQTNADAVICFENDKMGDAVSPRAGIHEAFSAADQTISQSVRAIAALAQRRGLIHAGLDELATALRQQNPRCLFGCGEAEGDNRAHSALEKALKSPLIDRGKLLEEVDSVLVTVAGGTSMTLNEVQILMEELNRHLSDSTRILFGTAVDAKLGTA